MAALADERLASAGAPVETWWFAAWGLAGGVAVYTQFSVHRPSHRTWYVAALVEPGRPSVLVVDSEMPWPRPVRYLEIRGRSLWCHHVCEEPLRRWSVGIEASGVAHDDPAAGLDLGWGDPDAIAADLEWEGVDDPSDVVGGYVQSCRVDGVLERVGRRFVLDAATGARGRWSGHDAVGADSVLVAGDLGAPFVTSTPSRWSPIELPRHGMVAHDGVEVSMAPTGHAAWRLPDGTVSAVAPVHLTASDGRTGSGIARWTATASSGP